MKVKKLYREVTNMLIKYMLYVMGKVVKMKMKENKMKFEIIECDGDVKEIVICEDDNGEEIFSMRVVDNVVEIWEGDNVKEVMLEVNE